MPRDNRVAVPVTGEIRRLNRRSVLEWSLGAAAAVSGTIAGLDGPTMLAADRRVQPATQGRAATSAGGAAGTVRRVVAANNAQGKSYLVSDESVSTELWRTSSDAPLGENPASGLLASLPSTRPAIEPPIGGTRVFIATIAHSTPESEKRAFHRTSTLDYIYVLNGEVGLLLDEGEAKAKAGDLIILRNAWHSWRNNADTPVRMLVTMVRVGKP